MFQKNKILKKILPKLIKVVIIAIALMLLHIIILGYEHFLSGGLDIQLHDTYFVFDDISLKILIFIVLYIPLSLILSVWSYIPEQKTIRPFLLYNAFITFVSVVAIIFYATYKDAKNAWVVYLCKGYAHGMPPNPTIIYAYETLLAFLCLLVLVSTCTGIKFAVKYYENKPENKPMT